MKSLFLTVSLIFSFNVLAEVQIACVGRNTESRIQLDLSGKFWLIDDAEYSFSKKIIPVSLNEASIGTNLETRKQNLILRFTTAKRHKKLKKNSHLKFSITQSNLSENVVAEARGFDLGPDYQARLVLEENNGETLIDSMDCLSTKID